MTAIEQLDLRVRALEDELKKDALLAVKRASRIGCKVNDKLFDNATVIQSLLDLGHTVQLDMAGTYYSSPLSIPFGDSGNLIGVQSGKRGKSASLTAIAPFVENQSHLVQIGNYGANTGTGKNNIIKDICFVGNPTCDGVVIYGANAPVVERCAFYSCKRGVAILGDRGLQSPNILSSFFNANLTAIYAHGNTTPDDGYSSACLLVQGCDISLGAYGIHLVWGNRAVIISCTVQGQLKAGLLAETPTKVTTIGSYFEMTTDNTKGYAAMVATKGGVIHMINSSCNSHRYNSESQINRCQDSAGGYTITNPSSSLPTPPVPVEP